MRILAGVGASLLLCVSAVAGEVDLSFNSDAVRAFYVHDFAGSDLQGDLGFANNSDKGYVINASLYVTGFASDGDNPLKAAVGGRTGYVDGDKSKQSGLPVALGGFLTYTFPAMNRLSIRGEAWFAPDILSLGDLDKYEDLSIRVQYGVLRQADVYIGARYLNAEFSNGSRQLIDNGLNLGLNFRF